MKFQVKSINVEFSKGSFSEWANASDEQTPDDVSRWEAAYNKQILAEIEKVFPYASIEVGEGYDQLMYTKKTVEVEEVGDDQPADYQGDEEEDQDRFEEEAAEVIDHILNRVANDGGFWNV